MSLACYVLYLEHDNRPHDVWAFATREEAELVAVSIATDVWVDCEGGDENEDELPFGEQLREILVTNNEYLRLYRCTEDGNSEEVALQCFETPQDKEAA
jgi:hypothetical protein